jgi:hypothetical protein
LLCAAGKHSVDPTWLECPYCAAAEGELRANRTVIETTAGPPNGIALVPPRSRGTSDSDPRPTLVRSARVNVMVNPFGMCTDVTALHEGFTFDLFRATLRGEPVCLKMPAGAMRYEVPRMVQDWSLPAEGETRERRKTILYFSSYETRVNVGSEVYGGTKPLNRCDAQDAALILSQEMEILRSTQGAWNHAPVGMGACVAWNEPPRPRAKSAANSWLAPVAVTPFHDAAALETLPAETRRGLFPRTLPALWDALCVRPHGDLSEGNILMAADEQRFMLIDPGVFIGAESAGRNLFTTNPWNYPVLFPHEHAIFGNWLGEMTLRELSALSRGEAWRLRHAWEGREIGIGDTRARTRPTAADLMALGLMYYRILTGEELSDALGLTEPAWCGGFSSPVQNGPYEVDYSVISEAALGTIERMIDAVQAAAGVKDLLRALVLLETKTREQLEALVVRIDQ